MGLSLSDMDRDGKERAKKAAVMVDREIKTSDIFPVSDYKKLRPTGGPTPSELSVMILSLEERVEELIQINEQWVKDIKFLKDTLRGRPDSSNDLHKPVMVLAVEHTEWVHSVGRGNLPILAALREVAGEVWEAAQEVQEGAISKQFGSELADIILRVFTIAIENDINIETEVILKMEKNRKDGSKGRTK